MARTVDHQQRQQRRQAVTTAADKIHAQLQDRGIIIRDRNKTQQYRQLADSDL